MTKPRPRRRRGLHQLGYSRPATPPAARHRCAHPHRSGPLGTGDVGGEGTRSRRWQQGVAFKRQVVLGERYIADFFAPSVGLVVEVDGGVHRNSRAADRRRDAKLRQLGYRVVRLDAALVLRRVEMALAVISAALR
jgi:Protein of unknown function (DUF559)